MTQTNLLDLITASAAPLDAQSLSTMLYEMNDTPCRRLPVLGRDYVAWPSVWHNDTEYILIQMPNDDLVALRWDNSTRTFWIEALAFSGEQALALSDEPIHVVDDEYEEEYTDDPATDHS